MYGRGAQHVAGVRPDALSQKVLFFCPKVSVVHCSCECSSGMFQLCSVIICAKCVLSQKCPECVNLVDPAGGAHDAPPDPLVSWGGDTPPQTPPSSVPRGARPCGLHFCSRLLSGPPLSISYAPLMYGLMNGTNTNDHGISSWDLNFTVPLAVLFVDLVHCILLFALRLSRPSCNQVVSDCFWNIKLTYLLTYLLNC